MPEWFITWGDLMSLLFCFFVLLQVFSEVKKDEEYERVVSGIQQAFGYSGGVAASRLESDEIRRMIELLGGAVSPAEGDKPDPGEPALAVARTSEGLQFTLGGEGGFAAESDEVSESMRAQLTKLAEVLAGRRNRIVIRGHAANKYLCADSQWRDLTELSYARARAVMDVLVERGFEERQFRIEAAGRWDPRSADDGSERSAARNRRVEIILTDEIVTE